MRRAPIPVVRTSSTASRPLRSKLPDWIRSGSGCASMMDSRSLLRLDSFQPKPSALATMRSALSSKAMKMPGSPAWAPCTRNCNAKMVLPEPGPPISIVVRPDGSPPPVISSKPAMPVRVFGEPLTAVAASVDFMGLPCATRHARRTDPRLSPVRCKKEDGAQGGERDDRSTLRQTGSRDATGERAVTARKVNSCAQHTHPITPFASALCLTLARTAVVEKPRQSSGGRRRAAQRSIGPRWRFPPERWSVAARFSASGTSCGRVRRSAKTAPAAPVPAAPQAC